MNTPQKLLAGSLLIGVSVITGNATLLAVAGGIGAGWTKDALTELWDWVLPAPGSAVSRAYRRAIEKGAEELKKDYRRLTGPLQDIKAFELVAASAADLSQVELSPTHPSLDATQQELKRAIAQLLYGHDEREVAFVQQKLLPTVARAFRAELVADDKAWREFHGTLIEGLARNANRIGTNQVQAPELLARLRDVTAASRALNDSAGRLELLISGLLERLDAPQAPISGVTLSFNNEAMQAGTVKQGQTVYDRSAHASDGGTANVTNEESGKEV